MNTYYNNIRNTSYTVIHTRHSITRHTIEKCKENFQVSYNKNIDRFFEIKIDIKDQMICF